MTDQPKLALHEPRGVRNNNPGNIRTTDRYVWHGQTGADSDGFCIFKEAVYGIRAMAVLFTNYRDFHDCRTPIEYISRWAPSTENNPRDYADFVASEIGVKPDEVFDIHAKALPWLRAVIEFENGQQPYSDGLISRAIRMSHTR